MRLADAQQLLLLAAAFDNRQPNQAAVTAWADALDGLSLDLCGQAVRDHYRESTAFVMPAHVRSGARRILADRRQLPVALPAGQASPEKVRAVIDGLAQQLGWDR